MLDRKRVKDYIDALSKTYNTVGRERSFWRKYIKINGSHGCVNSLYNVAKAIFMNIEVNTPVIC